MDFLQKHLAWFSKFYPRIQSKNCGRNRFLLFSFQNFFQFWAKNFQTFGQKTSKSFQNYLLRVQRNSLWPETFFLKFWIVLDFLQKHLAWLTKFYLRVQSKNCGKKPFICFLSRFFSNFEQKLFRLLAKKHQKVFKTTYVSRGIVCSLKVFSKALNRFGFSAETFGMVLKILSTCTE